MSTASTGTVSFGMQMSLDGYIATEDGDLNWAFAHMDPELGAATLDVLTGIDTFVMGRVNYQQMAAYWPTATEPIAAVMNAADKLVFSSTLSTVDWENARLATGSIAEEIQALKARPDTTIGVSGGARFAQAVIGLGLVDEFRLTIHPVVLGHGIPLFVERSELELIDATPYPAGAVVARYCPAGR